MNKEEILKKLNNYDLDKEKFVIISSAAMVLNNIKNETKDIDIAVDAEYEKEILNIFNCEVERELIDDGKKYVAYLIDDVINFSTHYYGDYKYEMKYNYNVQAVDEILKLKEKLGREKDKEDIKKIKDFINAKNINCLSLAYLGDAVYELYIRNYLLKKNLKVNDMQQESIKYVSAKSQSGYLDKLICENKLYDDEIEIVKRARNHKSHGSKSTDIVTYKKSTGLEALIGYLKMINNNERIEEIMKYIVGD